GGPSRSADTNQPRSSRGAAVRSNRRGVRDATFGLARSGDLNSVLEVRGDLLGERNDEVPVERSGDPGEGVDAVTCSPALLEPGDDRLGGAHPLCELALGEAGLRAQVVDELAEGEVLLDPGTGLGADGGALLLD